MNDIEVETAVAKALFSVDMRSVGEVLGPDERKAKWAENKRSYRKSARVFMRFLQSQGVALSAAVVET